METVKITDDQLRAMHTNDSNNLDSYAQQSSFSYRSDMCTTHPSIESFVKQDSSKPRLELIEPSFIIGLGKIITFGASKYGPNNWKKATANDIGRIKGALLRHTIAYMSGEILDPESGESHLYHAACNLMFLDYFDRHKGH